MKPPQPTRTTIVYVEEQTLRIERPHPHVRRHTHHTLRTYYTARHIFLGRTQRTQPVRRLPNCPPWPHTPRSTVTCQPHTYNRFHDICQKHALSDCSKNPSTHPILRTQQKRWGKHTSHPNHGKNVTYISHTRPQKLFNHTNR